jgi:hypothetical protein
LQTFLNAYQPQKQYKHGLKLSAKTIGGTKEFKCQAEVAAHCDAKFQACHVQMNVSRSAMNNEPQRWSLKAQAQLVMPETVSGMQEIEQLQVRNNKFTCQAQAQWGAEAQKQSINIRIKGEQVQRSAWRQLQSGPAKQGQQQKEQCQQQQQVKSKDILDLGGFAMDLEDFFLYAKLLFSPTFAESSEILHSLLEQIRLGGPIQWTEAGHPECIQPPLGTGQIRLLLELQLPADFPTAAAKRRQLGKRKSWTFGKFKLAT